LINEYIISQVKNMSLLITAAASLDPYL